MSQRLNFLFVVCFFFCSVGAMQGQAYDHSETVQAEPPNGFGTSCSNFSSSKFEILCFESWSQGYERAEAKNGFGTMSLYGYSSITGPFSGFDSGSGSDIIEDTLSIVGLNGEPEAFLKLTIQCVECAKYENYAIAKYYSVVSTPGYEHYCFVPTIHGGGSSCTSRVPLAYNAGQPDPVYLERVLQIAATTSVVGLPANAIATTGVCVGFVGPCLGSGAIVRGSVVDSHGRVIRGVTVVGASGYIYN